MSTESGLRNRGKQHKAPQNAPVAKINKVDDGTNEHIS